MWDAIKTHNLRADRSKESKLQTLITEFENLKMSDKSTIDDFAAKLSEIASKSASLGETIGFKDVVGRLKAYEERIKGEDNVTRLKTNYFIPKKNLLIETLDHQKVEVRVQITEEEDVVVDVAVDVVDVTPKIAVIQNPLKPVVIKKQKGKQCEQRDLSNIQCYRCDKYDHFASRCPKLNKIS
uniref:CCHC-type domain-containing protein n=1 Tax=Lactuca sativa TaxID=4236 RepID=A0A9R1W258_LACSA|nr:hypothetical protein LSAT_V11C300119320 [Lactuca sativa]